MRTKRAKLQARAMSEPTKRVGAGFMHDEKQVNARELTTAALT